MPGISSASFFNYKPGCITFIVFEILVLTITQIIEKNMSISFIACVFGLAAYLLTGYVYYKIKIENNYFKVQELIIKILISERIPYEYFIQFMDKSVKANQSILEIKKELEKDKIIPLIDGSILEHGFQLDVEV